MKRDAQGFTLVELAVVTAVIGVLSMMILPSLVDTVEARRLDAERAGLAVLDDDIRRSFQESDWSRNLAAFAAEMPQELAQSATGFGACIPGAPAAGAAWYAKLGRMRGISVSVGTPISPDQQKSLYELAFNAYGQPRLLLAAPPEPTQQRYLLLSLAAPQSKGLELPANDGSVAWFDAIWNNNWEDEGGGLPEYWAGRLPLAQQQAWLSGRGTTTNCHRLIVRRMVQPRFSITLNNSHQGMMGWADVGGRPKQVLIGGAGAPVTVDGFLAGSLVIFWRASTNPPTPGSEVFRIHLNDNTTFTVMGQP